MQARPYTILYIDLDHFKEVKRLGGHAAGDELLRRIGAVLRESVREKTRPRVSAAMSLRCS